MAVKRTSVKKKAPGLALARPGDPLVTPSGNIVQPLKPEDEIKKARLDTKIDPKVFRGKHQKNIKDLGTPINIFNAVGAVFAYSIMGVGDREIADALRCTVPEIEHIRDNAAYAELFTTFYESVISADSESLMGRIASYSHAALDQVAHLSVNGQKEEVKLRASTDLLDRAGLRPKDVDTRSNMKQDTLRIVVTKPGQNTSVEIDFNGG